MNIGKFARSCAAAAAGLAFAGAAFAQEYPLTEDVETIDGIIKAYYEVVSGPAGEPRQVARDKSLHHPDAQVIIIGAGPDGAPRANRMTLEEYHNLGAGQPQPAFFEYEIGRRMQRHGAVAHVWSAYETTDAPGGAPTGRGVNSIQLYHDGARWWITSWIFDGRNIEVPAEYIDAE